MIPETLDAALGERLAEYATEPRTEQVETALDALGSGGGSLRRFFEIYRGPFCGSAISYSLLDLTEQEMNIITQTKELRATFGTPDRYLVLSDMCGLALLVYDCETDHVFNMDLEGGEQRLIDGTLKPIWSTFQAFLRFFFLGLERT